MSALSDTKMGESIHLPTSVPDDRSCSNLERRLVRKLDLRMSVLLVLYTLNMIDRSNVSNARLQGFEKDLHLQGQLYATVLSILYVGFIIIQVPGNMFLHWVERPALFIPCCMIVWGAISVSIGFYPGVLVARLFLGFTEGPFLPGALFLISRWYKPDEIATRTALVSSGISISSAFGSLFASGILHSMQGILGQAAWRWLFYIEGGITILVATSALFILPDFPHNTKWLTPEERALAISRLLEDDCGKADVLEKRATMQGLWDAVSDWKVWWFSVAFMFQCIAHALFGYFPTLCATLGYDTTTTLLLCAPPWMFATIVIFGLTWYSDKKQKRYKYFAASNAFGTIGFIISISTMNKAARYISLFLMAQVIAGYLVLWGWVNNTFTREPAKRAVAIALINGMAQIGSVVGTYGWPSNWGPTYRYSYAISIGAIGVSTAMFGVMHLYLKHLNRQIEKSEQNPKDSKELQGPIGFRYLV
ncbi:major facilitator superfamily domain-containing protein [Suillus spraguei]|nr:major facilitator superfamily domain-containing protein [Suillus spraguei]